MTTHTHFLSALVLAGTAFPAQLLAGTRRTLLPAVLALLAWYLAPASGVLSAPRDWQWVAVALVLGCAAPAVEVAVGALAGAMSGRRLVFGGLHRHWSVQPTTAVPVVLLIGAAEEVVFRGVGQHLLVHVFGWPVAAAIALMALLYGLNHLYFGWLTVGQKVVTGLLYGALYQAGGQSVLVPVLAHLAQNLVVLLVLPRAATAAGGARDRP